MDVDLSPPEDNCSDLDSDASDISRICIAELLIEWAISFKVTHNALTALLHILNQFFPELPLCAKTLLGTTTNVDSEKITGGNLSFWNNKFNKKDL